MLSKVRAPTSQVRNKRRIITETLTSRTDPPSQGLGPGSLPFVIGAFASALDGDKLRCTMAIGENQTGHAWSESSINANAPQSSGVYAIYGAVWIYIGESNDIQRKLLQHWDGDNACITHAVPSAFAFEVCNPAERVRRQAALVARFRPLCNQAMATADLSQK